MVSSQAVLGNENSIQYNKEVSLYKYKRLEHKKGRHLSISGRLVLINSILSSLPLFYFSIYKAPKKVLETFSGTQRRFLLQGETKGNKINWVRWDRVCLPRKDEGLRSRNLNMFNVSLLSKWKWRMLNNQDSLWYPLLMHRYGQQDEFSSIQRSCQQSS